MTRYARPVDVTCGPWPTDDEQVIGEHTIDGVGRFVFTDLGGGRVGAYEEDGTPVLHVEHGSCIGIPDGVPTNIFRSEQDAIDHLDWRMTACKTITLHRVDPYPTAPLGSRTAWVLPDRAAYIDPEEYDVGEACDYIAPDGIEVRKLWDGTLGLFVGERPVELFQAGRDTVGIASSYGDVNLIRVRPTEVTIAEASDMLGISRQRVHKLIQSGALRARQSGSTWLIDRASVEERRKTAGKQ